jgi:hypothetical protein
MPIVRYLPHLPNLSGRFNRYKGRNLLDLPGKVDILNRVSTPGRRKAHPPRARQAGRGGHRRVRGSTRDSA